MWRKNFGIMTYGSIIKKYPKGIENRLPQFDRWVQGWKDPHIRSYYHYYLNTETRQFEPFMPDCQAGKSELAAISSRHRPELFKIYNRMNIRQEYFADDLQPSQDVSKMTIGVFYKECLKAETRSDIHLLAMWSTAAIVILIWLNYLLLFKSDYIQPNVQAQPHQSFYHYNIYMLRDDANMFIDKINMINTHSNEVFQAAKTKALARLQNK